MFILYEIVYSLVNNGKPWVLKDMRILGEGLVTDAFSGEVIDTVFEVKKAKVESNFSLTMSSTKASELVLTFDLYSVDIPNDEGGIDKVYSTLTA